MFIVPCFLFFAILKNTNFVFFVIKIDFEKQRLF